MALKTLERSLKDLIFQQISQRSLWDLEDCRTFTERPIRLLRDHWKIIWHTPWDLREINQDLWETDRDLWENNWDLWETSERTTVFQWSFMQIMVYRRSSCKTTKSFTGFYRFSLVFQCSLNDISIICQWSSPKMGQFLRDCRKIIERLVRPLSAHWEIAERLLKDHWKTIFIKDCRKTILNRFNFFWRPWRPWNSLKDHLGIMKDLGDHWKFTERSLRDLSIFRVFQWSFRGLALCGMFFCFCFFTQKRHKNRQYKGAQKTKRHTSHNMWMQ